MYIWSVSSLRRYKPSCPSVVRFVKREVTLPCSHRSTCLYVCVYIKWNMCILPNITLSVSRPITFTQTHTHKHSHTRTNAPTWEHTHTRNVQCMYPQNIHMHTYCVHKYVCTYLYNKHIFCTKITTTSRYR